MMYNKMSATGSHRALPGDQIPIYIGAFGQGHWRDEHVFEQKQQNWQTFLNDSTVKINLKAQRVRCCGIKR